MMILKRLIQFGLLWALLSFALVVHAQNGSSSIVLGSGVVTGLSASPDGHWLVVMTTTGAYLQDATQLDKAPIHLVGHYDMVWYASFSHDSRIVATASPDLTVLLWDTATGQKVDSIPLTAAARPPIFNADDSLIFIPTGTQFPQTYYLYDVIHKQLTGLDGFAPSVVFTEDGALVVDSRPNQNRVVIQHYRPGAEGFTHDDHELSAPILTKLSYSLDNALSADGSIISIMDMNQQTLDLIDVASERVITHLERLITSSQFTSDGHYAVVPTKDGIVVVDLATGTSTTLPIQQESNYRLSGTWLVYINPTGQPVLRDLVSTQETALQTADIVVRDFAVNDGGIFILGSLGLDQFDRSGAQIRSIESGGYVDQLVQSDHHLAYITGNGLTIIDLEGKAASIDSAPPAYIGAEAIFTDADTFFYETNSTQVIRLKISDLSTQNVQLPNLGNDIQDVAFSPDGGQLAFSAANSIRIVNAATGSIEQTFDMGAGWADKLVYTPDGRLLANTSDNKIGVWDLKAGKRLNDVDFGVPISTFAVSPDGQLLAVGNADGVSVATLQEALAGSTVLTPLKGTVPQSLTSMTFSPDGRWLAAGFTYDYSGGFDNQYLFLWDMKNHGEAKALENGYLGGAVSLAFSPDSKRIAAAGGSVNVWAVNKPSEPLYVIRGNGSLASAGYSTDGNWLFSTDFAGNYARKTYIFRAEDGLLRGTSQMAATSNGGGGGGDTVPAVPMAVSPNGTQFAAVDRGGIISLRRGLDGSLDSGAVGIVAYCDSLPGKPLTPKSDQSIAITWSWYAKTLQQVLDHTYAAYYEITLDGKPQDIYSVFPDAIHRDPVNDNDWTVYYRLYTGPLAAGEHTIHYRVTWNRQISDGYDTFGPDSSTVEQTGTCAFTVQ